MSLPTGDLDQVPGEPTYLRIAHALRRQISEEGLAVGAALPPEPVLGERFRVSRMTLRRAVQVLVDERLLVRRQGVGTFVASPRLSDPLVDLHSTRDVGVPPGLERTVRIDGLASGRASTSEARALELRRGERVVRFRRVDTLAERPVAVAECVLPHAVAFDLTEEELERCSTYQLIEHKRGLRPTRATQTIQAAPAPPDVARLLHLAAGSPILVLRRVTRDGSGMALELGIVSYRHDLMECTIELHRDPFESHTSRQAVIRLRREPRRPRDRKGLPHAGDGPSSRRTLHSQRTRESP
jgi:GntR family transcriptional regulator